MTSEIKPAEVRIFPYSRGYTEDRVFCNIYLAGNTALKSLGIELDGIVRQAQEELKFLGIRPIELSTEDAQRLRERIYESSRWREIASIVVNMSFDDHIDLEGIYEKIRLPWWNQTLARRGCDTEDTRSPISLVPDFLNVGLSFTHSYVSQLLRTGDPVYQSVDPASIAGSVLTSDGKRVFGLRGGHFGAGKSMVVPAGSLQFSDSVLNWPEPSSDLDGLLTVGGVIKDENVLFGTMYTELEEELALTRGDIIDAKLIARIEDRTVGYNSLFVFDLKTKLDAEAVRRRWVESFDKPEHRDLTFCGDKDLLSYICDNSNPDKEGHVLTPAALGAVMALLGSRVSEDKFYKILKEVKDKTGRTVSLRGSD